jgi:hypothetical protein
VEIKPDRMIYLGYGKYWRSDGIVGLLPIEDGRGPGRRTEVYVTTREDPIVASRSEHTILQDMASLPDEVSRAAEARSALESILEELVDLPPVLRRMVQREGGLDVDFWIRRLKALARKEELPQEQEDLFTES